MNHDVIRRANPGDDYELLQRVGSGTYGEVYKAKHIRTGEISAVKVIKLEAGDNFTIIQQEIHMIRECQHPNIIAYRGSYLRRDRLWIVMEYCGGGSLQDIYTMTGPLQELQIAFVCRETLKGLEYLHNMGKVHRDIKGANILLTNNGDVKLADFGVAAQITATIGKRKSFIGTPYWMAPEVASVEKRGGGYNFQCDVWAVGITAIELAECKPPHFDLAPMKLLYMLAKSGYKSPTLLDKHRWSPIFHSFVNQCLTKNPKKRPTPGTLLTGSPFVIGSLSNRLTRDLLEKVNGVFSARRNSQAEEHLVVHSDSNLNRIDESERNNAFSNGLTLPARDLPPLPDVVRGDSLLHDQNGVINEYDGGTLCAPNGSAFHSTPDVSASIDLTSVASAPEIRIRAESSREDSPESGNLQPRLISDLWNARPHSCITVMPNDPDEARGGIDMERPKSFFGLPIAPQVIMGACFNKILGDCPMRINCASTWVDGDKQFLILGCEEGIFYIESNNIEEGELTRFHHKRCSWLHVEGRYLIAMQGRTSHLYKHSLHPLMTKTLTMRFRKTINRIPEGIMPKKMIVSKKYEESRGAVQCTVSPGKGSSSTFVAVLTSTEILLYQWYDPTSQLILMNKAPLTPNTLFPLKPFHLIRLPGETFPAVCIGVTRLPQPSSLAGVYKYDLVKFTYKVPTNEMFLDSTLKPSTVANSEDPIENKAQQKSSSAPATPLVSAIHVENMTQIDRNTLAIAYSNKVVFTDLEGVEKPKKGVFTFTFTVRYFHVADEQILAFHNHGMQGKSLKDNSLTQDLSDDSKLYTVIGHDRALILRCNSVQSMQKSDLLLLMGHEPTPLL